MTPYTERQVSDLLFYLDTHNPSITGIRRHLASTFTNPVGAEYLIRLARYEFGHEIVIGEWVRGVYRYRTARTAAESRLYIGRRARIARSHVINCGRLTDRAMSKFPSEDPALMSMLRGNLTGVVTLLDSVR